MSENIVDDLMAEIKNCMKQGEKDRLTTLRGLMAQIKDATVNAGKEITSEAALEVMTKAIKQRQDASRQFREAQRDDLADKEDLEITWIRPFQPEQLDESQIEALVAEAIATVGATGKKDMGKVMGQLMPKVKGKADGRLVNQIVGRLLPG